MEYRPLEITVMSAEDLKNVNMFSKMDVYVVVSIPTAGKRQRTPADKGGGRSPAWKHRLKFTVAESILSPPDHTNLTFKIKSQRLLGDREIGEVVVPVRQLLHDYMSSAPVSGDCPADRIVDYQIRSASGKPKGSLKFAYKFGEKIPAQTETKNLNKDDLPVTAYPLPPTGTGYPTMPPPPTAAPYGNPAPPYGNLASYGNPATYPPQQPGYGYPPSQPGYGYPMQAPAYPQAPAYGYQPQPQAAYGSYAHGPGPVGQQQEKGKKKGGGKMGMGLGLGAGLLGGMLLGDMMSDAAEMAVDF